MPQANSTTSMPRATSPERIVMGLAVLLRNGAGDIGGMRVEQLLELEHVARALQRRHVAPFGRQRGLRGGDRAFSSAETVDSGRTALSSPVAGLNTGCEREEDD
jgi:hypothetical protein